MMMVARADVKPILDIDYIFSSLPVITIAVFLFFFFWFVYLFNFLLFFDLFPIQY